MKKKIGMVIAAIMMIVGIGVMLIPMIAQKQTKDIQNNLNTEYEQLLEENRNLQNKKEPQAQEEMDYSVADFEGAEEIEDEYDPEVESILKRQKILGKITCEKINMEFVVVEGASRDNIRASIGHITGTAGMGGDGNCVLAGHRGGYYGVFFKNIDQLEAGDQVVLTDIYDRNYTYEVYKQFVVEPTELWICDRIDGENTLTLLSCEDHGKRRLIVRCRLTEK